MLLVSAILTTFGRGLRAQSAVSPVPASASFSTPASLPDWANRGRLTFGFQAGYVVENAIPRNISHINLLYAQPQLGVIIWSGRRAHFPVQRLEILSEGILGNSPHPGGHLYGNALLFRLDGRPRGRVIPFFDVGAGVVHTTIGLRAPELSGNVQFTPQGGLGVQFFARPQRAVVIEYRYFHMSNAGIQSPNHGFNANMITVGFRWLRRPRS